MTLNGNRPGGRASKRRQNPTSRKGTDMSHRNALFSLVTLGLMLCCGTTGALDLARPQPTSFHCRGARYVAEIFPPKSRRNPGDKPLCYLYQVGYRGAARKIDARLKWKAELINDQTTYYRMPHEALVSRDGLLVTLNDYGRIGYKNAVVIYASEGKLVKSWHLDQLIPNNELKQIGLDMRGRWWNREARYFFLKKPARLYILLKTGKMLKLSLKDGAFQYGDPDGFPELAAVMAKRHPDEEVKVWATSLQFSSVTDVLGVAPEAKIVATKEIKESVAAWMKEVRADNFSGQSNPEILATKPELLLPVLKTYEKDPLHKVRYAAYNTAWLVARRSSNRLFRQDVVDWLISSGKNPKMWPYNCGYLLGRPEIFVSTDFSAAARATILELLNQEDPPRNIIRISGVADIPEAKPRLEELSRTDNHAWDASLALARMGSKKHIAACIKKIETYPDPVRRVCVYLDFLAYIRQPEVIPVLRKYLDSEERLPGSNDVPSVRHCHYALRSLSWCLKEFPVKEGDIGYKQAEIDACRKWIKEQKEFHFIRRFADLAWVNAKPPKAKAIVAVATHLPDGTKKLTDKELAAKIELAASAQTNPHVRFEAVRLLAISRFTPKSAEVLLDIACDPKVGRTTRGYAVMGVGNLSIHLPEDMQAPIKKRLREALATELTDTPDGIVRRLIAWGDAGYVQEILGDNLAGYAMEIDVLRATPDPAASERLWQLYLKCPKGARTEHYKRRAKIGGALATREDKRGIDILVKLLPVGKAPGAQYRSNNYNFIARKIRQDFGYKGGNYRRSLEKAVPKMIDWWKKNRDEFEFHGRARKGRD